MWFFVRGFVVRCYEWTACPAPPPVARGEAIAFVHVITKQAPPRPCRAFSTSGLRNSYAFFSVGPSGLRWAEHTRGTGNRRHAIDPPFRSSPGSITGVGASRRKIGNSCIAGASISTSAISSKRRRGELRSGGFRGEPCPTRARTSSRHGRHHAGADHPLGLRFVGAGAPPKPRESQDQGPFVWPDP